MSPMELIEASIKHLEALKEYTTELGTDGLGFSGANEELVDIEYRLDSLVEKVMV